MSDQEKTLFDLGESSRLTPPVRAFRASLLLGQRLRYLMDDRLRADGLTTQQAALLTVVRALDRPALTEAAAALGTTHQNAAQLVAALQRKGMLRTEPDPADKRRRLLVATADGARYWSERDAGDEEAVADWFAALTPDEVAQFAALAERILAGLRAA
ncbi:MarR family winged helix-turn-helix transcriptional regulator [Actinoplanes aureus]|uniref:MarR family transcriptional regulator n=1 Tax=Actinoplanes aureus TaxID=2792083 RepID=A0A931CCU8_9ACTN|nr:MarR family transcriptional regulator [Actinoplanes aureus]MBG0564236.1 MarR family transcriptional regulator [Actinoplanes aureus]